MYKDPIWDNDELMQYITSFNKTKGAGIPKVPTLRHPGHAVLLSTLVKYIETLEHDYPEFARWARRSINDYRPAQIDGLFNAFIKQNIDNMGYLANRAPANALEVSVLNNKAKVWDNTLVMGIVLCNALRDDIQLLGNRLITKQLRRYLEKMRGIYIVSLREHYNRHYRSAVASN